MRGSNVIVTGASAGIGQAVALRFAQEGANVAVNYRSNSPAETEKLIAAVGQDNQPSRVESIAVQADVSSEQDVRRMFDETERRLGPVNILVNNAGIQIAGASHESSADDFDHVIGVNLRGPYLCSREAIRRWIMRGSPGVVLNISSVHDTIPKPGYLGYSVSKGGMRNLTRTLALEYSDRGIRVNAIAPGAIETPMNRSWVNDPQARSEVERHIPMGRAGEAWEIGAAAVFLASDNAAYITGQTIYVDGGLTLYPSFKENWST